MDTQERLPDGTKTVENNSDSWGELLAGTEPVDWADLTHRYEKGENIFGDE